MGRKALKGLLPHSPIAKKIKRSAPNPTKQGILRGDLLVHALLALSLLGTTLPPLLLSSSLKEPLASFRPLFLFVIWRITGGALFLLLALHLLRHATLPRALLTAWIVIGILLRLLAFSSTPVQETDFYRYLLDGSVVAAHQNPYRYSPNQWGAKLSQEILKKGGEPVISQINYPELRTMYPPVAELLFALPALFLPWQILGLRLLFLLFDGITLALLFSLLRKLHLPRHFALIYWLHPLLLHEVYTSCHYEVLIFPFLLGAFLLLLRGALIPSLLFLSLAAATKIYPLLYLPLFLSFGAKTWRKRGKALLGFSLFTAALFLPLLLSGTDSHAGWLAYGKEWEMNDTLFLLLVQSLHSVLPHAFLIARTLVASTLALTSILLSFRVENARTLFARLLVLTLLLFLLSPTSFPWYSLWFLPLLVLSPSLPLLFFGASLFLYELRPYFVSIGEPLLFDNRLVFFELLPPLLASTFPTLRRKLQ